MSEVITPEDLKAYLIIDEDVEDNIVISNLTRVIKAADYYLRGAIGNNYPRNDPRAKELALMVAADMYENRTLSDLSANQRRLIEDLCMQLRLELRQEE